jgi:hypothetical protein
MLQMGSVPSPKRRTDSPALAKRPQKKSKTSNHTEANAKGSGGVSQRTLRGFFQPTSSSAVVREPHDAADPTTTPTNRSTSTHTRTTLPKTEEADVTLPSPLAVEASPAKTAKYAEDKVFDPIQAKEDWSKLLGKRVVPRCEHNEPCISLVTKKPGVNCGESCPSFHEASWPPPPVRDGVPVYFPLSPPDIPVLTYHLTRQVVLHLSPAAGTVRREGERNAMAMRDVHMEQ